MFFSDTLIIMYKAFEVDISRPEGPDSIDLRQDHAHPRN